MKVIFIALISILLTSFLFADCSSRQENLTATICFERWESNGAINTHPTEIRLSNYQHMTFIGGQFACVSLEPGEYSFVIHACQAYAIPCKQWTSPKYPFAVRKDETVRYEIYPTSKEASYTGFFEAKLVK